MAKLFDLAKSAAQKAAAAAMAVRNLLGRRKELPKSGPVAPPTPLPPVATSASRRLPRNAPIVPFPPRREDSLPGRPPSVTEGMQPVVPNAALRPQQPVPPAQPPRGTIQPTAQEARDIQEVEEVYTEVQLFGRDRGFSDDMEAVMQGMRRVSSSNVFGYFFELERPGSGLLYVTFLGQTVSGARTSSAGATYVYFDVPTSKFDEFQRASESSAGGAVWDYLRVRGSSWEHQHRYRLVQTAGDYIPRKATRGGFKTRQLAQPGQPKIPNSTWAAISRLEKSEDSTIKEYAGRMKQRLLQNSGFRRSTLPARGWSPNRGTPNRGRPNRGR